MGDCAKACTELSTPLRVRKVPKRQRKKVPKISTMFQTFIMPRFSCIITECRKAVPVSQGRSEAFSTGSSRQYVTCCPAFQACARQAFSTQAHAWNAGQQVT